ncbi:dihydrolipoyl dehydrogenase [Natrinema versiforme]|uniref:Dihydrolipoyl dehydrogenase n=1 Tax=Natrinema versiforme TaxID=88724 RepID=A0A4P8WK89_9EURY|nr:dihydrolipoyl dehydrogenase [Natrinema versiforme]QCS42331.1 dihydrolipoyl dehydrogenase [Natrinema versiforme]
MAESDTYDLLVLGGGMAGLPVSMKSTHKGLDTALVEQDLLGGTCLNRGCIPTKTMIRSAEVANLIDRSEEFGIDLKGDAETNMEAVVKRQQQVVESIRTGAYDNVENTDGLNLVEGHGTFESPTEVAVGDQVLTADKVVINTGARPAKPPIDGIDEVETLDSTSALELSEVPEHLVVIGGGYVGCEYAQMYARFGADITVFQRPDRLLSDEEPDVSEVIEAAFESEGIDVHTATSVERLEQDNSQIEATASRNGETMTVDASDVMIATGRQPNTDTLGLEQTGVETDEKGFVEVDEQFQTTEDSIWALGDVTGMPMFTHSARDDADMLYRHLVKDESVDTDDHHIPHAVFTDPEVGRVGLTEEQARDQGYEVAVGRSDYEEQGKPKALGETEGFVKIVSDAETEEILGAHVVGEEGAAIVHELVVAMELGGTAENVADAIHIHPTLPEVINAAASGVHKPS